MRPVNFALAAFFLYIACLQFNDPDPLYWLTVYAGTAAIAAGKAFGKYSDFWTAILIGAVAAGMIIATPGLVEFLGAGDWDAINDMAKSSNVEPAREFGGLLFALVLLLYYFQSRPQSR